MRHLFSDWGRVSRRIRNSSHIFLFLDYDGTLTPIVSHARLAKFPTKTKSLIEELKRSSKFRVAIISGRTLGDIKKKLGITKVIYSGNHGFEIEGCGIRFLEPSAERAKPIVRKIKDSLEKEVLRIKGAWVEDKLVTLALHFREVEKKKKSLARQTFYKIVKPFSRKIRIASGKEVLEVRPRKKWDKGRAVLYILRKKGKKALPVYLGDDVTDMDAFRAIKNRGISIFVGRPKRSIRADYFLKNPKEVEGFLKRLVRF